MTASSACRGSAAVHDACEGLTAQVDAALDAHLRDMLGEGEPALREALRARLQWLHLPGGHLLMAQGEPGDALYLVVGGRLHVQRRSPGAPAAVACADIRRGGLVGELALLCCAPRAASVSAARDSLLVRLGRDDLAALQQAHPGLALLLARQALGRLHAAPPKLGIPPATMALLPVTDGVDALDFAQRLAAALRRAVPGWRVAVVGAGRIDAELGLPAAAHGEGDAAIERRIALRLAELEATHDQVLLVGDARPGAWARRCIGHAEEVLWLADAERPLRLQPQQREAAAGRDVLVLLHPAWRRAPCGTRDWLARWPAADHVHLRADQERDLARLARLQSRTAVGLVLAGGGARGFAHLGVWRALRERGIEIDCVGGSSIGAVMATYVASDQPAEQVEANARHAFASRPTGDLCALPLLALYKGQRLRRTVGAAVLDLVGFDADVEDLWKSHYSVATNVSRACAQVLRRGNLVQALLASVSVPGVLPPVVVDGELLCDGGIVDNFPVEAMRGMRGVGRVIGVDLDSSGELRLQCDELPGGWALLRDWLRRPQQCRLRDVPTLAGYLRRVTVLHSSARQRESAAQADLCLRPPLGSVGLLDWHALERIADLGYRHACTVLDAAPALAGGALRWRPAADGDSIPAHSLSERVTG